MKAKASLSFVFATVLGFTVYSTIVHGVDTSLWIGTPIPTKTMMQQNVTSDIVTNIAMPILNNALNTRNPRVADGFSAS